MDRYKFRAKRLDNGEWVYGYYQAGVDKHPHVISEWEFWQHEGDCGWSIDYAEVDPSTVGQYTGVHEDGEGDDSELYDGDVVKLEYEQKEHVCKVVYEGTGFMLVSDSLPDGFIWASEVLEVDRTYWWLEGAKKIGNVIDNPNLLEG